MRSKRFLLSILLALTSLSLATAATVRPSSFQAVRLSEGNCPVGSYIGALDNSTALIAGGTYYVSDGRQTRFSSDIYLLTATSSGYECVPAGTALPEGMSGGCSVVTGKSLYCLGGYTSSGYSSCVMCVSLSGQNCSVARAGVMPDGFRAIAAASWKGSIYVHGNAGGESALYRLEPVSMQWTALAPCPGRLIEEGCTFAPQHNGRESALYLIGGCGDDGDAGLNASNVWEYLPMRDTWVKKTAISEGCECAASLPYGSAHVLCFGSDEGEDSGRVWAYHAITDTWNTIGDDDALPVAAAAFVLGGRVMLVSDGGHSDSSGPMLTSLDILDEVSFGWINYAVVALYLLGMLGVGFYFSRKNNNTEEFFKGGGRIPWWAAGISIFATALSAITFLSIPAKAYAADWKMFIYNMTILMIVPVVVRCYLPFIKKLNVASVYQYLENRFSSSVRYLASAFFCIFMFARVAIVLFLPSLALNAVTGLDIYLCIVLMGVVTIIYCTMGGIEAVVWGDVIQGFLLVGGAILSFVWIVRGIDGGFGQMMTVALSEEKFHIFDFSLDLTQPVFWVAIVGGFANQILTYTSDQSVVQKYLTVKDSSSTEKGLWLNGILAVPVTFIFLGIGTGLYVFFKQHPDMLNVGMTNTDSIFPHYMMCQLPVGIAGLLIAAVFAAAMSTLASNINSSTTVMSEDFYAKLFPGCTDDQKLRFARVAGVIVGGLGVVMAIVLATFDIASLWDQFNFFLGLLTSGLGGLFMMGIFTDRIGTRAALTGFAGSIVVLLACSARTDMTSTLYGFTGLLSCFVTGYLASFIYGYRR